MRHTHALLGAALLLLGTGCASRASDNSNPLGATVVDAKESPWRRTGLPYGGLENDGADLRLSFGEHSVVVPARDPGGDSGDSSEGQEEARLELSTAGATVDAGLFQLTPPGERSQLWGLTRAGEWTQIGVGMSKIALADPDGHLVSWVEGAADDARLSDETKLVAFDTRSQKVLGKLDGSALEGTHVGVTVVDGDSVVVQVIQATSSEHWVKNYVWKPGISDELTLIPDGKPEDLVTISDYDSRTGLRLELAAAWDSARIVGPSGARDIGLDGFGRFNRDASLVVATGYGRAGLFDTATAKPVSLDVPISSQEEFVPGAFAWTSDGSLAVIGSIGDERQGAHLCIPATGRCQRLGYDYLWFSSLENSARGQAAYHAEPEGD